jgi:hypothetical protein
MTYIYALTSGKLVLYVGKTSQSLTKREYYHRHSSNRCNSRYIPEHIDWTIKLLETVPNNQETIKEQYYYDTLKPLYNRCRPGQTDQEYENYDRVKAKRHEYQATTAYKERKKITDRLLYLKKKQNI